MAKTDYIELGGRERIPILYEDRSVIAIDKPSGWMLVPFSWQRTRLNLQAAVTSSIAARDYWARCRNLKWLRHVHRLDAETSGVLLWAKSLGALDCYGGLFESRKMAKVYLAVVSGIPKSAEWSCCQPLGPDPQRIGAMRVDPNEGKDAETHVRVVASRTGRRAGPISLLEVRPVTGRTHQIRVHLAESGHPVVHDPLYGAVGGGRVSKREGIGLRSVELRYHDPFRRKPVRILAPTDDFLAKYGFAEAKVLGGTTCGIRGEAETGPRPSRVPRTAGGRR